MTSRLPGDLVGRYRLQRLIDDTGRSQVWIAHDEHLDRNVAVKVRELHSAAEAGAERARFEQAARIAARVEHPGAITVYESGGDSATAFLAMRLVLGRSLDLWLAGNPKASTETRFLILAPVAEALDHAHAVGIAHGSVSVANVLVDESTQPPRGVVAQFGQADVPIESRRAMEGDRIAFAQVISAVLDVPSPDANAFVNGENVCVEMLRSAMAGLGSDPRPTPPTIVRTRRAQPRTKRIAVIATTCLTIVIVVVGALELLQDGMATFSGGGGGSTGERAPQASAAQTASGSDTRGGTVLILGDGFTSRVGAWTKSNRKAAVQRRRGIDAADVVQAALLENPKTLDMDTVVVRMPMSSSASDCRDAVDESVRKGPFDAIVVLESPCTLAIARTLVAGQTTLPPVYWLDDGSKAPEVLAQAFTIAPPIDKLIDRYEDAAALLRDTTGNNTGENFARVLPFGTYRDVGGFMRRQGSLRPCFYLASRDLDPRDATRKYTLTEDLRIAYSIVELANGFRVSPSLVDSTEIIQPYSNTGEQVLPSNGTVTGSTRADREILDTIKAANPTCLLVEIPSYESRWGLRLVNALERELPNVKIIQTGSPHDAFDPHLALSKEEIAAFENLMNHPNLYTIEQHPYVSYDAPLRRHVDGVFESLYRPIDSDRDEWFTTDEFALPLVAELIGTQAADRGDGRPGFGRLPATAWAVATDTITTTSAPVEIDPVERNYTGYLVTVYNEGLVEDIFYNGASEGLDP